MVVTDQALSSGPDPRVVRVGGTVHRAIGPWMPASSMLLSTVRRLGVEEVPAPLGVDERGRHVVDFIHGDAGDRAPREHLWSEHILDESGSLLRRFHDASAGLVGHPLPWKRAARQPVEVICHNELELEHLIIQHGHLVGLVDLDEAAPGPRLWDVARLAYVLVPLREDAGVGAPPPSERWDRLQRLLAAYGRPWEPVEIYRVIARFLEELAPATADPHLAAIYRRDLARARRFVDDA